MMWVAPKSWPSNSSEYGTSSSPMKQAARTANACSESSIRMASLVVTASPSIDCGRVLMSLLSIGTSVEVDVRVGDAARRRLLEDALGIQAILGPVDDHRRGRQRHGVLRRIEVAIDRVVFVIGEVEHPVVDATEAFLLHHRQVPLLQMHVDAGVSLAPRELLAPGIDRVMDAEAAITPQHDAALELAERLEPAQPHRARGLAVDIHDHVRGGVVVAVELLVVRAMLLTHEHGSA